MYLAIAGKKQNQMDGQMRAGQGMLSALTSTRLRAHSTTGPPRASLRSVGEMNGQWDRVRVRVRAESQIQPSWRSMTSDLPRGQDGA